MQQPHNHPVTCSICGGGGMGTIDTAAAGWDSNVQLVHNDINVCRKVLMRRAAAVNEVQNTISTKLVDNNIDEEQHY